MHEKFWDTQPDVIGARMDGDRLTPQGAFPYSTHLQ
jgi:hypothetical protein